MSNLANHIESHIRRLLDISPNATILLQRKELAVRFQCVPSQITYVLTTRFTPERGYMVESRRGGGGFLRIRRLDLNRDNILHLLDMLRGLSDEGLTAQRALDLVSRLEEARLITRREGLLMKAALGYEWRPKNEDALRALMLAQMLEILLHES